MNKDKLIDDYKVVSANSNNYLALKAINGLGNRIRAYIFYKVLAKKLNRKFYLCWEKTIGFDDTPFDKMFATDESLISDSIFNKMQKKSINLNDFIQQSKCKQYEEFKGNQYSEHSHKKSVIENVRKYNFLMSDFSTRQYKDVPLTIETSNLIWPNFLGYEDDFNYELSRLKLSPEYQKMVSAITCNFNKNTYGIHIRKGDAVDKNNPDSHNYLESHDDKHFTNTMDKLIATHDDAKFFLATDGKETFDKFKAIYGNRIIENPNKNFHVSKYNTSKDGQLDALIDMFCLANTKIIIGTSWSTFCWIASGIGKITLMIKKT